MKLPQCYAWEPKISILSQHSAFDVGPAQQNQFDAISTFHIWNDMWLRKTVLNI